MRRAAWLAAALLWGACAGAQTVPNNIGQGKNGLSAGQSVQMEPFYFEGGGEHLDIYTDTDLFKRAADAYDMGDWKSAFNLYRKIIDKFPGSDYRILALFNGGLCLEQLAEYERALEYFRATQELVTDAAALSRDIHAHVGAVGEKMGRWAEAAQAFQLAADRTDVTEDDRYQFLARARVAAAYADDSVANVDALTRFIDEYRRFLAGRHNVDNEWLARSVFSLGEIHFRRFRAVTLELPQEKLQADLEQKAEHLLRAQNQFMRTLQIKNIEWATAAVYRIGLGYEEFYRSLNNAPVPPELSEEERGVYVEELRQTTEPVRQKAMIAYDRIISFSNRLSVRTDWVEKAKQRVVELRTTGRIQ